MLIFSIGATNKEIGIFFLVLTCITCNVYCLLEWNRSDRERLLPCIPALGTGKEGMKNQTYTKNRIIFLLMWLACAYSFLGMKNTNLLADASTINSLFQSKVRRLPFKEKFDAVCGRIERIRRNPAQWKTVVLWCTLGMPNILQK